MFVRPGFQAPKPISSAPAPTPAPAPAHSDYTAGDIHYPFNWVVADAAAKTAIVPVASDVYKALWQIDTGAIYILTDDSPVTWVAVGSSSGGSGLVEESGSFTPFLYGSTTAGVHTYSAQTGYYRKLGSLVQFTVFVILSAKDATMAGEVRIGGLPFKAKPDNEGYAAASIGFSTFVVKSAGKDEQMAIVIKNDTYISLRESSSNNTLTTLPAANITNNSGLMVTGTYVCIDGGAAINSSARETLLGDRTYYVRTDGNDSNNGLTNNASGAFLTLQKAATVIERNLDLAGYNVTVQVADGTYTAGVILPNYTGGGNVTFLGNAATPANVLLSMTAVNAFTASCARTFVLNGFKIQCATSGRPILATAGAVVNFLNIDFGACPSGHLAATGARISAIGNYAVSGGGQSHASIVEGGVFEASNKTVTITNTPAFSIAWIYARANAVYSPFGSIFTGSATGSRYNITHNSSVFVNGAGVSYLPGNSAGFIANGAAYQ